MSTKPVLVQQSDHSLKSNYIAAVAAIALVSPRAAKILARSKHKPVLVLLPGRPVIVMLAKKKFTNTVGHAQAGRALTVVVVEVSGGKQEKIGTGGAVADGWSSNRVSLVGLLHLPQHCRGRDSRFEGGERRSVGGGRRRWQLMASAAAFVAACLVAGGREGGEKRHPRITGRGVKSRCLVV